MERKRIMSKVLLINGSPHEKGCTAAALNEMIETFKKANVETELIHIGKRLHSL